MLKSPLDLKGFSDAEHQPPNDHGRLFAGAELLKPAGFLAAPGFHE
jgi:hypothetical protein